MRKICRLTKKIVTVLALVPVYLVAGFRSAYAASLGSLASNATSDLLNVGKLIEMGAYLIGLCFVVTGFMKLAQTSNQQGAPKGPGAMLILIGVVLLGIGVFISATSSTFGDSGASTGLGKLGIGG